MRDRRDDERYFRGPMGTRRDGEERGAGYGAGWGGQREHGGMVGGGREDSQWGRDRDRYDRDFGGRQFGGWGRRMGGSDLGFAYGGHERMGDLEQRGPHYGKGPKGYRRSDERIHDDVCDTIARQGYIDASDVEVKVESGVVILSGTVEQRHHKRVLERMVERVHGVDDVRNELRLQRDDRAQPQPQTKGREGSLENGDVSRQFPNGRSARA